MRSDLPRGTDWLATSWPCCARNTGRLRRSSKVSHFAIECNSHARAAQTNEDGVSLPDPIAVCIALDQSRTRSER